MLEKCCAGVGSVNSIMILVRFERSERKKIADTESGLCCCKAFEFSFLCCLLEFKRFVKKIFFVFLLSAVISFEIRV